VTWFYNNRSGEIENESPPSPIYFALEAELHLGTGWHAYATEAELDAAVAANGWPAPTTNLGQNLSNETKTVPGVSQAATVAGFLGKLQDGSLWQRVAEIAVGGILLIIAIKAMATPVTEPITQGIKKTAGKIGVS
jgi:hypothetical protein